MTTVSFCSEIILIKYKKISLGNNYNKGESYAIDWNNC